MKSMPVRTLYTMPCADIGVGMTCHSILLSAAVAGYQTDLSCARAEWTGDEPFLIHQTMPWVFGRLPYRYLKRAVDYLTHRRYLSSIRDGDVAYLWPSVPIEVYETLAARNIPIVAEAVNTLMSVAKPILDAAYDDLGLPPNHGITQARIANQERRFALCAAVFVPNRLTEEAMAGSAISGRVIGASYGTWVPRSLAAHPAARSDRPVRFLFLGTACVRKGIHKLLDAWRSAPPGTELRIVGRMEPEIRQLFADVLNRSDVSCSSFTRDVASEYRHADVSILPSFEEGDPIATYEAAAHGVPVMATTAGAGRLGERDGIIEIFDNNDKAQMVAKIAEFAASEEQRRHRGEAARHAVAEFDWGKVGARRFARLHEHLGNQRETRKS